MRWCGWGKATRRKPPPRPRRPPEPRLPRPEPKPEAERKPREGAAGAREGLPSPGKFVATGRPRPPAPPWLLPAPGTHLGAATSASWARRCGPWRKCTPGCRCRARGSCWGCSASCWPRAGPSAAPSPAASGGSSRWRWPLPWLLAGSPATGRGAGGGALSPGGDPSPGAAG